MRPRVTIIYNEPFYSQYDARGEQAAVTSVLDTVEAVHHALLELGYEVAPVPLAPPLGQARKRLSEPKTDLVFNLFEGFAGYPETEAKIAETLSALGIPYTGCPPGALRLALDKAKTKLILRAAGINTPAFQLLRPKTLSSFRLNYPCIVKPRQEDASNGLSAESVVYDFASLKRQVASISHFYGGQALVEEFINGREFNATVLGNDSCTVLPVSEITYSFPQGVPPILTFAAKWQPDSLHFQGAKVVCPAEIETKEQKHIAQTTLASYHLLGCRGYARVDMRQDEKEQLNVIEVNPNPDISLDSGAVRQAQAAGMAYHQFIQKIVQLALEKEDHDHQDTPDDKKGQASPDGNTAHYARVHAR